MSETVVLRGPERPDLLRHEVLADIYEATAYAHPEQIALIAGERQLSYEQLDAEASRAAHRLIEAGIGPGDMVGLWLPRGIALLSLQLAIAKTGAKKRIQYPRPWAKDKNVKRYGNTGGRSQAEVRAILNAHGHSLAS